LDVDAIPLPMTSGSVELSSWTEAYPEDVVPEDADPEDTVPEYDSETGSFQAAWAEVYGLRA